MHLRNPVAKPYCKTLLRNSGNSGNSGEKLRNNDEKPCTWFSDFLNRVSHQDFPEELLRNYVYQQD